MGVSASQSQQSSVKLVNVFPVAQTNETNEGNKHRLDDLNRGGISDLIRQNTQPKILVSINTDNTVKISHGKSIATQTPRNGLQLVVDDDSNNVENRDSVEMGDVINENRQHRAVQTDIITTESQTEYDLVIIPTKYQSERSKPEIAKNESSNTDDSNIYHDRNNDRQTVSTTSGNEAVMNENEPVMTENEAVMTENEAGETDYWTDTCIQTDDDVDNELGPIIAWGSKSADSATTLLQNDNDKESYNKEDKEADTQMDCETPMPTRTFDELSLERYGKYKVRLSSDEEKCIISSATFLKTGDAVVIDRSNTKMKFVDNKFQYISSQELPAKPWAVCARGVDVYVTMGNTKIQHLTVIDMIMETMDTFQIKGRCLGICVFGEYLAVGLQIGEVCLLDFSGKKQGTIQLPTFNGKSCNPWHLLVTPENNILVTDSDAGAVYCVTKNSELIFTFKGLGSPRGTAIDLQRNILVVGRDKDTGAVVTILNKDMELRNMLHIEGSDIKSRVLLTWEELEFVPYCICHRSDNVVVLGGIQEALKIMRIR